MITSLQGVLASATPLTAVIEINGIAYEANIPVTTAEKLPAVGATVKLHTVVIYREDAQTLYGFASTADRDFFRLMIEHVTGVGPKMALSIMSKLSLASLEAAISRGDVALLAKCPGIGKKTAERLVVELRSKVGSASATGVPASGGASSLPATVVSGDTSRAADAVKALIALGYRAPDADEAVRRASLSLGPGASTEELIKKAFA
ncbi:MAG: Holliday junction branch migration protein RuvA [Opitutaceae bacterium]|nr:Holliday junction branch migration protein RuvA [Opitutaceae bacterium]